MNDAKIFKRTAISINMIWIFLFVLIPNLLVVGISFMERDPTGFFSFEPSISSYLNLFDPINARIFTKSLAYSLGTTFFTLAIGYPFAWFLSRVPGPRRPFLLLMVIIPFWTSSLIRTYALVILMKANGIINGILMGTGLIQEPISILYTDFAVYVGLVYSLLPFMILPVYAVLEKLDTRLLEAARDLGAGTVQIFFKVIFPLSLPGIMAGCIMVFLPSMGLFYIPDLLGGAKSMIIGNFIKNQFLTAGNWPFGSAVSVFLILIMAIMMALYLFFHETRQQEQNAMKRWIGISWLSATYAFLYIPLVTLMVYSFNQARFTTVWKGFSLKWYIKLFENQQLLDALFNSLIVAAVSSVIATIIGTLGAFAVTRYKFAGRKIFFGLVHSVMMSPDIVMGISLLMLFVLIGIETGFLTLVLAHITFCLPFVIVTVYARINDFDPAVVDAARDLGAKEFQIFSKIILPMILPAVLAGWLLSFTLSLDDVIISFFVTGPEFEILPLKIYSMVRLGVKPEVNALCTILFLFTLVAVIAAHFLIKEKKK